MEELTVYLPFVLKRTETRTRCQLLNTLLSIRIVVLGVSNGSESTGLVTDGSRVDDDEEEGNVGQEEAINSDAANDVRAFFVMDDDVGKDMDDGGDEYTDNEEDMNRGPTERKVCVSKRFINRKFLRKGFSSTGSLSFIVSVFNDSTLHFVSRKGDVPICLHDNIFSEVYPLTLASLTAQCDVNHMSLTKTYLISGEAGED